MTTIQVHYDGWLSLPVDARQMLGVTTGDRLEAEIVEGAVVLRPVGVVSHIPEAAPKPSTPVAQPHAPAPEPAAKRGPGRPRKLAASGLAPNVKVGGRRKSMPALAPQD